MNNPSGNQCVACKEVGNNCSGNYPCNECNRDSKICAFEINPLLRSLVPTWTRQRFPQTLESINSQTYNSTTVYGPPTVHGPAVSPPSASASLTSSLFCKQVSELIRSHLGPNRCHQTLVGEKWKHLQWPRAPSWQKPDLSGLPSLDRFLNTSTLDDFHSGLAIYFLLIDRQVFVRHFEEFRVNPDGKVLQSPLWFVQFQLVLAFVNGGRHRGRYHFTRAIYFLPDYCALRQEPILAIRVLSLIALYFQSIDLGDAAYSHIGQAMRMALAEGLHQLHSTTNPKAPNGLFLTVYNLDQRISALNGLPPAVADEEVGCILWPISVSNPYSTAILLQVRVSQFTARLVRYVHPAEEKLSNVSDEDLRSRVLEMVDFTRQLDLFVVEQCKELEDFMAVVKPRLLLLCHLSIMIATRPIIARLLRQRLDCFKKGESDRDLYLTLPKTPLVLLNASGGAAFESLKILKHMRDTKVLNDFDPFDLESLFSATVTLVVTSFITPNALSGLYTKQGWRRVPYNLLRWMESKGSPVAARQLQEALLLESLLDTVVRADLQGLGLACPSGESLTTTTSVRDRENNNVIQSPVEIVPECRFPWAEGGASFLLSLSR
ncbi:hypothetical protein BDW59DRAFT_161419 [Aspergillus cavernicola]|uniref:Xylanolytic transcriptional activator regulatory domain-containing protein n=1 Tax=Aspergillus cavernicola TaxID=176166 RepID=A0ABR4IDC8_9EURO